MMMFNLIGGIIAGIIGTILAFDMISGIAEIKHESAEYIQECESCIDIII